jgi:hypothetical protein
VPLAPGQWESRLNAREWQGYRQVVHRSSPTPDTTFKFLQAENLMELFYSPGRKDRGAYRP